MVLRITKCHVHIGFNSVTFTDLENHQVPQNALLLTLYAAKLKVYDNMHLVIHCI